MRVMIAEDDPISRYMLEGTLAKWGYDVVVTCDGGEAWALMQEEDSPRLAILDWMMPRLDGVQVCKNARKSPATKSIYIILLTAKGEKNDIVSGLDAGADDYLIKPFNREELQARLRVGVRTVGLRKSLSDRVDELADALSQIKQLQGILPICSYCKKVRDDQNYWQQVENYFSSQSEVRFTHSVCPCCYETILLPEVERLMGPVNARVLDMH